MGKTFYAKLAGVSHRNRDGSDRQAILRRCSIGEQLRLKREPDNPHDSDAVAVFRLNGEQLGYLPSDVAAGVAPRTTATRSAQRSRTSPAAGATRQRSARTF